MMFAINPEILFTISVVLFAFKISKVIYDPESVGVFDAFILGYGYYLLYKKEWNEKKKDNKVIQVSNMLEQLTRQLNQVVNEYEESEKKVLKQLEKEKLNGEKSITVEEKPSNPFLMEYSYEDDDIMETTLDLSKLYKDTQKSPSYVGVAAQTPLPDSPRS